jgi:TatA/E family protein of Tat protein translocase
MRVGAMGPLGFPELLFIFVLALLLFGPKRLPEIGRTIGKGMAEFRKASNELKRTIETEISLEDEKPRRPTAVAPPTVAPRADAALPPGVFPGPRPDPAAPSAAPQAGETVAGTEPAEAEKAETPGADAPAIEPR